MAVCTFFGHGDCPGSIAPLLRSTIESLIRNNSVTMFYVGNHGRFDALARSALRELRAKYPQIEYAVVLAYMPKEKDPFDNTDFSDTIFPEGIENVPRRFSISWRNKWMLSRSEYVITYVTHSWGGAAQFAELAKKQHKTVYDLAELTKRETVFRLFFL